MRLFKCDRKSGKSIRQHQAEGSVQNPIPVAEVLEHRHDRNELQYLRELDIGSQESDGANNVLE